MQIAGGVIILFGDAAASDFREKFDELVNEYRKICYGAWCFVFFCLFGFGGNQGGRTDGRCRPRGWMEAKKRRHRRPVRQS